MSTWLGVIVATTDRAELASVAARHGVTLSEEPIVGHALIECDVVWEAPLRLAQTFSRELSTMAIGFVVQTNVDSHETQVFVNGESVRHLSYEREGSGWHIVRGAVQAFEPVYFFDEGTTQDGGDWPGMLGDEISDEDIALYEEAKALGDASKVLALLGPSSTAPMRRVCAFFSIDPDKPAGHWKKPSIWSRLWRRGSR